MNRDAMRAVVKLQDAVTESGQAPYISAYMSRRQVEALLAWIDRQIEEQR